MHDQGWKHKKERKKRCASSRSLMGEAVHVIVDKTYHLKNSSRRGARLARVLNQIMKVKIQKVNQSISKT